MAALVWARVGAAAAVLAMASAGCSSGAPGSSSTPPSSASATAGDSAGASDAAEPGAAPTSATGAPEVLEPSEPFGRTTVVLRAPDGTEIAVPAYDAFDQRMRQRGLMHREALPATAGMVFRFSDDRDGGFWMRNTLIPLSIAYFAADGEIVRILDMEPCTTVTCPSYPPGARYRGALEVNQGFFAENGVQPGWFVELPPDLPAPS